MSVTKEIETAPESPAEKYQRGTTFVRIDVLSQEDGVWLPYAKSLAYRARQFLKATNQHYFARHYHFGDVKIFIKLGPGTEYIRVRAGVGGTFIVIPVVYKISTDATTEGDYTFLNGKLTKATAVPTDLFEMVSMFPHKVSKNKPVITGVVDASTRGYFTGQTITSAGEFGPLAEYAGVFKHTWDFFGTPTETYLHARATDVVDPVPPTEDGIYYGSGWDFGGDEVVFFDTLSTARRPAVHETMFVSADGRKIVAEEWFPYAPDASDPPTPFDAMPFFVLRSIIDIDLVNFFSATPQVVVSDYLNPNGYPASAFEATGTGSIDIVTSSSGTAGVNHTVEITAGGTISAPISTALDAASELVSTTGVRTVGGNFISVGSKSVAGPFTYEHSLDMSYVENMVINCPNMTPLSIDLNVENLTGQHTKISGDPLTDFNYSGLWARRRPDFMYSSTSIPALIYRQADFEFTMEMFEALGTLQPRATNRTERVRVIALVGTRTVVLSEVTDTPADADLGVEPSAFGLTTVAIRGEWDANDEFMPFPGDGTVTESPWPDGNTGNIYFRGERRQGPIPEYQGLLLSEYLDLISNVDFNRAIPDAQALFAAHSTKSYIGSVYTVHNFISTLPPDPSEYSWVSFSHSDTALKKTIVNHVLAPEEPIEGVALDDYKIWFTYLRAI